MLNVIILAVIIGLGMKYLFVKMGLSSFIYYFTLLILGGLLYIVNNFLIKHFISKGAPAYASTDEILPNMQTWELTAGTGIVPKWVSWIGIVSLACFLALIVPVVLYFASDVVHPVTYGMIDGKVIGWNNDAFFAFDKGTVYKPEANTVIFVARSGTTYENREEWAIEASCGERKFIRGIGITAFKTFPDKIMTDIIDSACNTDEPSGTLEHPFPRVMNATDRENFIYSSEGVGLDTVIVDAINYWGKSRLNEQSSRSAR